MARRRSPARLVIALSVATVLAIFLLYTSIAAEGTPTIQPSEARGHDGRIAVAGRVVSKPRGNAHRRGLRFTLRDIEGRGTLAVIYRGSVPDLFKRGRDVVAEGELRNGVLVADDLLTKCPSKYKAKED